MRIVFLSYHYSSDIHSPEEWVERLKFYNGWLEYLAKEHDIIRVDQINYEGNFSHHRIEYHCVNDGKKVNYFPWKLNRFVKELEPDVVVVSSFHFPLQVIQLRSCLGNKVRIIIQHHAEQPVSGLRKYMRRISSAKADAFLFASRETGAEWVTNGNLDSINKVKELMEVSTDFHPLDKIAAREKTKAAGSPMYLWVGRLNQNKDPLMAVRAFLTFSSANPGARLYMIYHTDELLPDIKILLASADNGESVVLIGKLPHEELLCWFNSADFFLSASHYEGSGTALCEALSCGCIPVITNISSFKTISQDSGILYQPGNDIALLTALQQSLQINREEKSGQVVQRFNREFSFKAIADKFLRIAASLEKDKRQGTKRKMRKINRIIQQVEDADS